MSDSKSGANNPMYGRTGAQHPMYGRTGANHPSYGKVPANAFQSGANNPMYGRTGANHPMYGKSGELSPVSIQVNVYSVDNVLVGSFSSQVAAAEWLGVSNVTVHNYIKSGKVWNNKYMFRKSTLLK